jgi:hypothetical protein
MHERLAKSLKFDGEILKYQCARTALEYIGTKELSGRSLLLLD